MSQPSPWRKLLIAAHITFAVALVGTDLVLLVLGIAGLSGKDPQTVYPAAHMVGAWLVAPFALLALITGVTNAFVSHWGLAKYWWTLIKFAVTAVLTVLVLFVLVPGLGAAADAATSHTAEVHSKQTLLTIAPAVATVLLVMLVFLAVYKPRWRVGSRAVGSVESSRDAVAVE